MLDLKPYGAFIENTIRPLFAESETLLKEFFRLNLTKEDLEKCLQQIGKLHLITIILDSIKTVICTAIVGYVAWTISQS